LYLPGSVPFAYHIPAAAFRTSAEFFNWPNGYKDCIAFQLRLGGMIAFGYTKYFVQQFVFHAPNCTSTHPMKSANFSEEPEIAGKSMAVTDRRYNEMRSQPELPMLLLN
jgi:hypothetical protein